MNANRRGNASRRRGNLNASRQRGNFNPSGQRGNFNPSMQRENVHPLLGDFPGPNTGFHHAEGLGEKRFPPMRGFGRGGPPSRGRGMPFVRVSQSYGNLSSQDASAGNENQFTRRNNANINSTAFKQQNQSGRGKGMPKVYPQQSAQNRGFDAPPTYDEALNDSSSLNQPKIIDIVNYLKNFKDFWCKTSILSRLLQTQEKGVLALVQKYTHLFTCMADAMEKNENIVEFCPQIKVCTPYANAGGCQKKSCSELHICGHFVSNSCTRGMSCLDGHLWKSGHNLKVLSKFYMDQMDEHHIQELVAKSLSGGSITPQVCSLYNNSACSKRSCKDLHICLQEVLSLGRCDIQSCSLNHSLCKLNCELLLHDAGISTNEAPRDLLKIIVAGIPDAQKSKDTSTKEVNQKTAKSTEANIPLKTGQNKTVLSSDLNGNVESPNICFRGMINQCDYYANGCKFLHSQKSFHWQILFEGNWLNLSEFQSKILEENFTSVQSYRCFIPPLKDDCVGRKQKPLLTLLGTKPLYADFNSMTINSPGFKGKKPIRRLSTASSASSTDKNATTYRWYFCGEDDTWKSYDDVSQMSSKELEKEYIFDPNATITFESDTFRYCVDFKKMVQTNISSGKERAVRRRPMSNSSTVKVVSVSQGILPSHWQKMEEKDAYTLVNLHHSSSEFKDLNDYLKLTFPFCAIRSIERVQNAHLWKQFENKKQEIQTKNKRADLNVTKLFYGLKPNTVQDVCCNNIEWRIHGDAANARSYGDGTYFSNSSRVACQVDVDGSKIMLIAYVILGIVTVGSEGLTRPPQIPGSDVLYDTTVDSLDHPTTFVKYSKQEYYPAYVVTLKD